MAGNEKAKKVFFWVGGIAAILAILDWAGVSLRRGAELKQAGTQNVSSKNQAGGITAGQVIVNNNYVKPPRRLTDKTKAEFAAVLRKCDDKRVTLTHKMMDREAKAYAEEIKSHLGQNGYEVVGFSSGLFSMPSNGQRDVFVKCVEGEPIEITVDEQAS